MSTRPASRAFDTHAPGYDNVAESALGRTLRARVHAVVARHLTSDATVLDLGCGSGIDTAWLARRAHAVHATDPSTAMADRTRDRCADLSNVTVHTAGALDLELETPVDMVVANFGAINCAGPLNRVGQRMAAWLRPGGIAVLVTMPPICPLERAIAIATRNRPLWQRRRSGPVTDRDYRGLTVNYATAATLSTAFTNLDLVAAESLGLALPPFEQRSVVEARPRLLAALATIDDKIANAGGRVGWGDHLITTFQHRAAGTTP